MTISSTTSWCHNQCVVHEHIQGHTITNHSGIVSMETILMMGQHICTWSFLLLSCSMKSGQNMELLDGKEGTGINMIFFLHLSLVMHCFMSTQWFTWCSVQLSTPSWLQWGFLHRCDTIYHLIDIEERPRINIYQARLRFLLADFSNVAFFFQHMYHNLPLGGNERFLS